jgi:hypothetical protein
MCNATLCYFILNSVFCYHAGDESQAVLKADNVVIKHSVTEITEVATRRKDYQMAFSFRQKFLYLIECYSLKTCFSRTTVKNGSLGAWKR